LDFGPEAGEELGDVTVCGVDYGDGLDGAAGGVDGRDVVGQRGDGEARGGGFDAKVGVGAEEGGKEVSCEVVGREGAGEVGDGAAGAVNSVFLAKRLMRVPFWPD
jgi:hypothetical protein